MFGIVNNKKDYPDLGGEIHQDRKRRERIAIIIFAIISLGILNLVLYFMSNA